jgi:hypothetical protein
MTGRYQTRSGIYPGVFGAPSVGGILAAAGTIHNALCFICRASLERDHYS